MLSKLIERKDKQNILRLCYKMEKTGEIGETVKIGKFFTTIHTQKHLQYDLSVFSPSQIKQQ